MSRIFKLVLILNVVSLNLHAWAFQAGSPSEREKNWQKFMEQGKRCRERRRLADAERNYLAAVSAAEPFGSADTRLAASLNGLGTAYHEQGRYADAELCYRKAQSIWQAASEPGTSD
jgi:tetratricopeptide (TPR) repeat protein